MERSRTQACSTSCKQRLGLTRTQRPTQEGAVEEAVHRPAGGAVWAVQAGDLGRRRLLLTRVACALPPGLWSLAAQALRSVTVGPWSPVSTSPFLEIDSLNTRSRCKQSFSVRVQIISESAGSFPTQHCSQVIQQLWEQQDILPSGPGPEGAFSSWSWGWALPRAG